MDANAVIEREHRWAVPTALLGFLSAALLIVGLVLELAGIPHQSSTSGQLVEISQHPGVFNGSAILTALGFLLSAVPLSYLFRASAARSPRVRQGLLALCFVGPLLFGAHAVIAGYAVSSSGDDFVAKKKLEPKQHLTFLKDAIANKPDKLNHVTIYNTDGPTNVAEAETDNTNPN